MCVDLHVMYLLFMSDSRENWPFSTFSKEKKNLKY